MAHEASSSGAPKSLGDLFNKRKPVSGDRLSNEENSKSKASAELESYCSCATIEGKANPLEWWRVNELIFPNLAVLAKKYLSICATSVSSERLFSLSGHIVSKKRTSLSTDHVNQMVFLASNL